LNHNQHRRADRQNRDNQSRFEVFHILYPASTEPKIAQEKSDLAA
jgi:hypothetical protein